MPANTRYVLTGPLTMQNTYAHGTFGIVNRDPGGAVVTIGLVAKRGMLTGPADSIDLPGFGDSMSCALEDVASFDLAASSYPATILFVYTPLDINLEAAPAVTADPGAPLPVTVVNAVATTYAVIDGTLAPAAGPAPFEVPFTVVTVGGPEWTIAGGHVVIPVTGRYAMVCLWSITPAGIAPAEFRLATAGLASDASLALDPAGTNKVQTSAVRELAAGALVVASVPAAGAAGFPYAPITTRLLISQVA